jgi:hypothetical protein
MENNGPIAARVSARFILIGVGVLLAFASAVLLFLFNPAESAFYPRCFFKMFTGLDCPGCGGLRAAHRLLHGDIGTAFALNPLLVGLLPFAAWFGLRGCVKYLTGHTLPQPFRSVRWVWVLAAGVIAFGILRNLPLPSWPGS